MPPSKSKRDSGLGPLDTLRKLMPPQTLIHVGAGSGIGPMHQWHDWQIPEVWLIDAVPERLAWTKTKAHAADWHTLSAVLDADNKQRSFHCPSNPDEAGLIAPQALQAIWPNLQSKQCDERQTRTLDALLEEAEATVVRAWIFIDCLPALLILRGAAQWLQHTEVLWLRTLLQPMGAVDEGATLQVLEAYLQPLGFRTIAVFEGNHPAIGHVLFARDWHGTLQAQIDQLAAVLKEKARLAGDSAQQISELIRAGDERIKEIENFQQKQEALNQAKAGWEQEKEALMKRRDELQGEVAAATLARDQQGRLAGERQAQIEQLSKARDGQDQLASDRQQHIEALNQTKAALEQEKGALVKRRDELQDEVAAATLARDQQGRLAGERQAQIEQLSKTRDEQAKLASDRQQHIEALNQARATLEEEKGAVIKRRDELQVQVAAATQARDQQGKLADERQIQIVQLQSQLAEWEARQHLLFDEMTRAEAQIDLIKDVLLREPGL